MSEIRQLFDETLPQKPHVRDYLANVTFPDGQQRTTRLNARRIAELGRTILVIAEPTKDDYDRLGTR